MVNFDENTKRIIKNLACEAISISKQDWETSEASLEYDTTLYIPDNTNNQLESIFDKMKKKQKIRFNRLKSIEEEINYYTIT